MSISNNLFCQRKINSFIKQFTNTIITNTDVETHAIVFNNHRVVFKMSVAKTTFPTPPLVFIGYFQWTWGGQSTLPECVNAGIAFSGWADPSTALQQSLTIYASLNGSKYISLGGGMGSNGTCSAGAFTYNVLYNIYNAINNSLFSGYSGILFDVEYVLGTGLYTGTTTAPGFQQVFQAAKSKGLSIVVCVGHSGNIIVTDSTYTCYSSPQDLSLMSSFLSDPNVDWVSPQLYSSGSENPPQFNVNGLPWSAFANSGKQIIPALPWAQQFETTDAWAMALSPPMTLSGGIQWNPAPYNTYGNIRNESGSGSGGGSQLFTLVDKIGVYTFTPPSGVTTFTFTVVGGGGGESTYTEVCGGGNGALVTATYTNITSPLTITIGGGGGGGKQNSGATGNWYGGGGGGLSQVFGTGIQVIAGGGGGGGAFAFFNSASIINSGGSGGFDSQGDGQNGWYGDPNPGPGGGGPYYGGGGGGKGSTGGDFVNNTNGGKGANYNSSGSGNNGIVGGGGSLAGGGGGASAGNNGSIGSGGLVSNPTSGYINGGINGGGNGDINTGGGGGSGYAGGQGGGYPSSNPPENKTVGGGGAGSSIAIGGSNVTYSSKKFTYSGVTYGTGGVTLPNGVPNNTNGLPGQNGCVLISW
jgi:hypothetical protein